MKPFRYANDSRFSWLLLTFLKYFENWKNNLEKLGLSNSEKNRMFVSQQTYDGIRITTHSVIGVTKHLLNAGMPFVLTSRFNQDCLEEQFGLQRSLGRTSTNPSVFQIGYQSNILRMQRSVGPATGNSRGTYKKKREFSWYNVEETQLKKCMSSSSIASCSNN